MSLKDELKQHIETQQIAFAQGNGHGTDIGWWRGYGFRAKDARGGFDPESYDTVAQTFSDSMDYYNCHIEQIDLIEEGDICLVWGFHIEDFKHKNKAPEKHRVRFSMTMRKTDSGSWEAIFGHRDIQQFDENGMYLS